jgi:hypothetical protein
MRTGVRTLIAMVLLAATTGPAVGQAATTVTEDGLLSGMATEAVAPGVVRVANDGYRDISVPDAGSPNSWIRIGPDDDIWVFGERSALQLGEAAEYTWDDHIPWAYEFAPDGTLWGLAFESVVSSLDGESWTERARLDERASANALAVAPDGAAWVVANDFSECPADSAGPYCTRTVLLRIDESGMSTVDGWREILDGRLAGHVPVVGPDGDVWLLAASGGSAGGSMTVDRLLRYDGTDWRSLDAPEGMSADAMGASCGIADDGTLWTAMASTGNDWHGPNDGLARLDESGWTVFAEADGVPRWGGQFWFATDYLRVAPDGSAWVNAVVGEMGCDGVARFDGETWTPFLAGHCVDDFAIASDGSVWVLASATHSDPVHLYAIAPGATTGME